MQQQQFREQGPPKNNLGTRHRSYVLADTYCFWCKDDGELAQCSNCPKRYHLKCLNIPIDSQLQDQVILCPCCQPSSDCIQCNESLVPSPPNPPKPSLYCTVCYQYIHFSCSHLFNKLDIQLMNPINSCINQYVCRRCLFDSGIQILIKKTMTKENRFWLVSLFYSSSIHAGWFQQDTCLELCTEQTKRVRNNIAQTPQSITQKPFQTRSKIDKILSVKAPIEHRHLDTREIIKLLFDPTRIIQYGKPGNFKFLVKWCTLETETATWQDEFLVMKIGRKEVEDYLKYFLCINNEITLDQLRRAAQTRQSATIQQLDIQKERSFMSNRYYFMNRLKQGETANCLISFINNFYVMNSTSKPAILVAQYPDVWYDQLRSKTPHFRVCCLTGSQNNILCQFQNEMFIGHQPQFDILIVSPQTLMMEFQKIREIRYDLLVLDCQKDFQSVNLSFMDFKSCYTIIRYSNTPIRAMYKLIQGPESIRNEENVRELPQQMAVERVPEIVDSGFEEYERLVFLKFILYFGLNIEEPENILAKLITLQRSNPTLQNNPESLAKLKLYIKQFLHALNDKKETRNKKYFQNFQKSFIISRIISLSIFKTIYLRYKSQSQIFPMPSHFLLPGNKKNKNGKELYTHAWRSKDDIELMRLILKYGYKRWKLICDNFYRDCPNALTKGYEYLMSIIWPNLEHIGIVQSTVERIVESRASAMLTSKTFEQKIKEGNE